MLLFYTHTDPFELIIEVLIAVAQPCPNLLLYVTGESVLIGNDKCCADRKTEENDLALGILTHKKL